MSLTLRAQISKKIILTLKVLGDTLGSLLYLLLLLLELGNSLMGQAELCLQVYTRQMKRAIKI
jgi:hypothetical protein